MPKSSQSKVEKVSKKDPRPKVSMARQQLYLKALSQGYTAQQIACKLAPDNPRHRRRIRGQIQWLAAHNEQFQEALLGMARGEAILESVGITEALVRRAKRGRVDSAKFLFEFAGIHNPRIQHDHSGEVKISLQMPRPAPVENPAAQAPQLEDGEIIDAEVVEE